MTMTITIKYTMITEEIHLENSRVAGFDERLSQYSIWLIWCCLNRVWIRRLRSHSFFLNRSWEIATIYAPGLKPMAARRKPRAIEADGNDNCCNCNDGYDGTDGVLKDVPTSHRRFFRFRITFRANVDRAIDLLEALARSSSECQLHLANAVGNSVPKDVTSLISWSWRLAISLAHIRFLAVPASIHFAVRLPLTLFWSRPSALAANDAAAFATHRVEIKVFKGRLGATRAGQTENWWGLFRDAKEIACAVPSLIGECAASDHMAGDRQRQQNGEFLEIIHDWWYSGKVFLVERRR